MLTQHQKDATSWLIDELYAYKHCKLALACLLQALPQEAPKSETEEILALLECITHSTKISKGEEGRLLAGFELLAHRGWLNEEEQEHARHFAAQLQWVLDGHREDILHETNIERLRSREYDSGGFLSR